MAAPPVNLSDPDLEPSDEQFAELMSRAFAGVAAANEAALARMRQEIASRSREILLERGRQLAGQPRTLP